ncbi:FAD-containing oxidoreductase [Pseudaminobacter sp. 19-2017]|uniref:FAD-containing oxidoreductase n=1 Tax=Pseudaminobacter soli (ex Zhang et al. 2022) TaxID=2831468 RepID=A0A942I6U2_9HYPH|nr:FAD-containing oxidoreductase [Pseudaminobacter soli]MBS3647690.1 FAD-containing oxidoreductase [Pseudaminobacter soli]
MSTSYDAIVIGAGQAGPSLTVRLAKAGMRVALIERKYLGGTCVNTGCKPTKTMVASAYAARMAQRAAEYGVVIGSQVGVDLARVMARKDKVVLDSRQSLRSWLRGTAGVTLMEGHARFRSASEVEVDGEVLTADKIFLNVGGRALVPDLPGIRDISCLTNSSILELDTLPEHLVVVGGSYIGLEFGQMFRRFGSRVTIIEKGSRLVHREDEDVSQAILDILSREGIGFRLNAECLSFKPHGRGVAVAVDCKQGEPEVAGSHVLLAIGRRPNTDDLGLDAGVALDESGFVQVDDQLRTSVPNIWALGECNGRGAFTHTAYNDYEIVAANILDNDPRRVTDRFPCYALFTDPPLGRVGMTETEARESGGRCLIGRMEMARVGRAVERGETDGFMKVIVDADSRQFLGASILGASGDEVVHGILDLMYARASVDTLVRSVPIHPTVSELLPTLCGNLQPLK